VSKAPEIAVTKSFTEGCVGIRVTLCARGYSGASVNIQGSTNITTIESRELAMALIALADEADAKIAKSAAAKERRDKWREREIAAGRMIIMKLGSRP
jgi:hypothetical protein